MLGNQNQQLSFSDIENWCDGPVVAPDSIYGHLSQWGERLIRDEDFAALYSYTGRPSVSPALLSKVLLLMYNDNISDREAEERAKYDLRWKVALGLPLHEAGFDFSALSRFRTRLLVNQKQKLVFERFVRMAAEAGIVKGEGIQIIDSTHVLGAGAVKDTYTLIKTAIQKLLHVAKKHRTKANQVFETLSLSSSYRTKDKEPIDWNDANARQDLLNYLVQDAKTLVATSQSLDLTSEEQAALDILVTVSIQDVEETKDGTVTLKQGVAKDRIISVHDPEMRHGHKTSSGRFNGHKAQVVEDQDSEMIVNVSVTPGNGADGQAVTPLIDEATVKPGTLLGDTAYGTLAVRDNLKDRDISLLAPLPVGRGKHNRFSKYDFQINFEKKTCQCPTGETTTKTYQAKGQITAFVFNRKTCNRCPMRDKCTKHGKGKIVSVHPEEETRRTILDQNNTSEFCQLYRKRSIVERKIAHLTRRGIRKARYIGRAKTTLQVAFAAAVVNLKRMFILAEKDLSISLKLQQVMSMT